MICAGCGAENRAEARFCDACGAALAPPEAPPREQRKVVTVLFCDVTGSTALGERLDPEALRAVMGRYFETARTAIERHGGTVEKFIGDAVMAVFGVPVIREDDALRAVRAAAELRDAVEVDVRIGVNTGQVVTGRGETLVTGDAVNVAARLEQAAGPGEVLLGAETLQLVRDAVEVELLPPLEAKGKSEPVTAYRLVAVTGETAVARRFDAPLVGREREQRMLADAWERVCSERASALVTVLGAAGVGKSRLAQEFLDGLDATIVRGRCLSYGEGITYWPVVEVVLQLLDGAPPPDQPIAALLGEGSAPADEIALSVRKLFETKAAERPLVVVFDDLHWAEAKFLDLIEHVADWSRGAPILLLCMARPDLLELRPSWGGGKLNATTALLESLSADETDELIDRLLEGSELDSSLRERIRDAAEGNPLFVEQMLAMVDGAPGEEVPVPPSIQALLAARLDQLPESERVALQSGAVEGQVFHRGAVSALDPREANVSSRLLGLVRKELVRPTEATFAGDDAFRFRHLLIRDAAYDALPKAERAELHERFAGWVSEHGADLIELDEILGYHLEQAALYRSQLGAASSEIATRAVEHLRRAARRAEQREDPAAAIALLSRALVLIPEGSSARDALLPPYGRALYLVGKLDEADRAFTEAIEGHDVDAAAAGFFFRAFARGHGGGSDMPSLEEGERTVAERLAASEGRISDETMAGGYTALGWFHFWSGKLTAQLAAAGRADEYARRAGAIDLEGVSKALTSGAVVHGGTPWSSVREYASELRGEARRLGPRMEARALDALAYAAWGEGRLDEARSLFTELLEMHEERGHVVMSLGNTLGHANLELSAGDPERAEEIARLAWDRLGEVGERGFRSSIGGALARALVELGRVDEGLAVADEAESLTSSDDWHAAAGADLARALAASRRGDHEQAILLADRALALAEPTEYFLVRIDAWLLRGRILLEADRHDAARASLERSVELATAKGSTFYVARAQELLAQLPAAR